MVTGTNPEQGERGGEGGGGGGGGRGKGGRRERRNGGRVGESEGEREDPGLHISTVCAVWSS